MDDGDLRGERGVRGIPLRRDARAALAEGGTGDLEQAARALNAVACALLRLDEMVKDATT